MTPEEPVQAMAARLSAINWVSNGDKAWSRAALLDEYFRRAAQWAGAYECDTRVPFFDIAACVDPNVRADQRVVDEVVTKVKRGGWDVKHVTPFILHWAALRAAWTGDLPSRLDDPFEPLVLLFERDGGFLTRNGEVDLEYLSIPMGKWRTFADRAPMTSFAPEDLDEIDRAGSMKQFGYVMGPDGMPIRQ
jgi:hypothetical protein